MTSDWTANNVLHSAWLIHMDVESQLFVELASPKPCATSMYKQSQSGPHHTKPRTMRLDRPPPIWRAEHVSRMGIRMEEALWVVDAGSAWHASGIWMWMGLKMGDMPNT